MAKNPTNLLDVDNILRSKAPGIYSKIPRFAIRWLERKIHQEELNDILTRYHDKEGVDFMNSLVEYFGLKLNIKGLENLPTGERYIFASNHPLGGLDGICLSSVVGSQFNGNIKYPVNDLLLNIKNLKSIFIPINKHGNQDKGSANLMNEAFASDNQIITFPAGLCSRKYGKKIEDPEWKKMFVSKAIEYQRTIVPVYFHGYNSNFFYRFANMRKRLGIKFNIEMLFLPDEMFKNKNKEFAVIFGEPISWKHFDKSKSTAGWVEFLREKTYDLAPR